MRTLQRNKRVLYYALYKGLTDVKDTDGNYTGEKEVTYYAPVKVRMNISGGRGRAEIEMFGVDNPFTHTVVTDDLLTPFDTDTIWWFGRGPCNAIAGVARAGISIVGNSKDAPYNFRCTGVSRTINQVVIALEEVKVTDEASYS